MKKINLFFLLLLCVNSIKSQTVSYNELSGRVLKKETEVSAYLGSNYAIYAIGDTIVLGGHEGKKYTSIFYEEARALYAIRDAENTQIIIDKILLKQGKEEGAAILIGKIRKGTLKGRDMYIYIERALISNEVKGRKKDTLKDRSVYIPSDYLIKNNFIYVDKEVRGKEILAGTQLIKAGRNFNAKIIVGAVTNVLVVGLVFVPAIEAAIVVGAVGSITCLVLEVSGNHNLIKSGKAMLIKNRDTSK
jgi:hypothetical protein